VVGNAVDAPEVAGSSNKEEVTVAPATKALRRPCMDEFKNIFTEGPFVESVESRPPQIIVSNVCWVKSKTLEFDRWPNPTSDSRSCVSEVWRVCGHLWVGPIELFTSAEILVALKWSPAEGYEAGVSGPERPAAVIPNSASNNDLTEGHHLVQVSTRGDCSSDPPSRRMRSSWWVGCWIMIIWLCAVGHQ